MRRKLFVSAATAACLGMTGPAKAGGADQPETISAAAQTGNEPVPVTGAHRSLEQPADAGALGSKPRQLVANVEYEVSGVPGLSPHANMRYFGDAPVAGDNALIIPGYTPAGAGFASETTRAGRDVALAGNGSNLFDEKYRGLRNSGERINGALSLKVD